MFMEKKFVLTEDIRFVDGRTLYRIRAEENFSDVRKGDLGGFVEKEENLSQLGDSWVYDEACVYDNARIYHNACVYGEACVFGNACVYENARIYDEAYVRGDACIYHDACVYGRASVYGDARIYNSARIYDDARVFGDACVCGNANIFENALVCGKARVYDEARVCECAKVQHSRLNTDLRKDLKASLRCQCNLIPENGKVIAYKLVHKTLCSLYDKSFVYKIGEFAVCENPKEDNSSCSPGLHFSNLTYWDNECAESFDDLVYLKAEIDLQDIITIQHGKIRCRKARILSKIEIE